MVQTFGKKLVTIPESWMSLYFAQILSFIRNVALLEGLDLTSPTIFREISELPLYAVLVYIHSEGSAEFQKVGKHQTRQGFPFIV